MLQTIFTFLSHHYFAIWLFLFITTILGITAFIIIPGIIALIEDIKYGDYNAKDKN